MTLTKKPVTTIEVLQEEVNTLNELIGECYDDNGECVHPTRRDYLDAERMSFIRSIEYLQNNNIGIKIGV